MDKENKTIIEDVKNKTDLYNLLENTNSSLQLENQSEFSGKAFDKLKNKISIYITELVNESVKNSKRTKSDNVSATHVEKASNYLFTSNRNLKKQIIGTLGGVFLGATFSNILSLSLNGIQPSILGMSILVILTILGVSMIAYNLTTK